jgi:(2R)-3-sulfolactate dehydrogenase (NADP+)
MPTLSLDDAREWVASALVRSNTSAANAASVARALVAAEADGLKGHGLSRVPTYAAQAKTGKVDGHAVPAATRPRPGVAAIDAAHGFAFPAIDLAVEELARVTPEQGIAAAPIRRSHHCGAMGLTVERLADRGLAAMMFANSPPAIAPWGGRTGLFGTNPIAFACPRPEAAPLAIDLSLSKVARGNILAAKQRGEAIPEGWALNRDGQPTTDPDAALAGTMVPAGDAKGTVLALMVELLAASLVGANTAAHATSFLDTEGGPPGTGQLIVAFDPGAFAADAVARFGMLADEVAREPGARLPGSRRLDVRAKAAAGGLAVPDALFSDIERL